MNLPTPTDAPGLAIRWSAHYQSQWDDQPDAYVRHGIVALGRSRRLARATDTQLDFKGYLGVQSYDPGRWHVAGEPTTKFFVSLFLHGRTVTLRTYPTCHEALAALHAFHIALLAQDAE